MNRWICLFLNFMFLFCAHLKADVALQSSSTILSNWNTGFVGEVTITNSSNTAITAWTVHFALQQGQTIHCLWNGTGTVSNQNVTVTNDADNGTLMPGQSITLGFQTDNPNMQSASLSGLTASGTSSTPPPSGLALNATYVINPIWATAYQGNVTLTNNTSTPATSWTATFVMPQGFTLSTYLTNGSFSVSGQTVTVTNLPTNGNIAPGGSVSFTMIINMPLSGTPAINNLQAAANGSPSSALATPVLQAINNPNNANQYQISWSAVPNAQTYLLQESTTSSFTNPQTIFNGSATTFQVTGKATGTYYYRVTAAAGSNTSSPSNVQSTTVGQSTPTLAAPVLQAISNPNNASQYQISWSAVSNASTYALQESTTSSFTNPQTIFNGSATTFQVTGKTTGTYYYRVTAAAGSNTSSPSNVQSTTVGQPTPPVTGGIEHSVWYIDWTSWFNGPTYVLPTGVNMINVFVGEINFDANGNPTMDGFGNLNPPELDAFVQYCNAQQPPIPVKVSIGGSGGSYDNCWDRLTSANVPAFAKGMADYCHAHGLVGVDFDYEEFASAAQETLVGTLIKAFKAIDPSFQTSLCTNAAFGPNAPWQAAVQTILNAATIAPGNCAVDRLYIMSYYDPIASEEAWILSWANWLIQNYGFTPARVSVGIDDFDAHAYDPVAFAAWAASQGFSTAHWAFDPAHLQ